MADQRSVMKEYRLLEQKRQSGQLTAQEEARFAQLRDLVGTDTGVGASRPGFDVNAAAARLRESLLPAGLRNRPPSMPEPPPPEPVPEPVPEPAAGSEAPSLTPAAMALESVWKDAPFAPLAERPSLAADALFDPGTLGEEGAAAEAAWDPNAQPYDQAGQPYDPNAPQQWDASAQGWDPNAQPYDQAAQPDDPNAPQQWDAGAQGWDPNAQPHDQAAQPYDPNAPQQWDAGAQGWDPNTQPYDQAAQPDDPNAPQQWDPNAAAQWEQAVQPAWDPSLAAPWGEQPAAEPAEPMVEAGEAEFAPTEPYAEPAPEALAEAAGFESAEPLAEGAIEATGLETAEPPAWETEEPLPEVTYGAAELAAAPPSEEPPAEVEPLAPPEELLPFDASVASAIGAGAVPEGWGAEPPSVDLSGAEPALGTAGADYGDLSPEQPAQTDALPSEEAQGLLAPLAAGQELTSDDDAFAQGFQLASNGSFGEEAAPTSPAWSETPPPAEPEDWESAPSLDLSTLPPAGGLPPLDLAPPPEPSLGLAPAPLDALDEIEVEEIPVEEESGLLEELPPAHAQLPVRIGGTHRVVVHTVEGLVKRGAITDVTLDAATLPLAPQPGAEPEQLPTTKVKAIFFMLAAGEQPPAAEGKKVRVTFNDGRQIAGFSPDYSDAGPGFFMIPADTRTNTGRIWVYRSAVKTVSVT